MAARDLRFDLNFCGLGELKRGWDSGALRAKTVALQGPMRFIMQLEGSVPLCPEVVLGTAGSGEGKKLPLP